MDQVPSKRKAGNGQRARLEKNDSPERIFLEANTDPTREILNKQSVFTFT